MAAANDFKLLVVDDDQNLLDTLCSLFRFFKFNVTPALDATVALDLIHKEKFDLVLTDARMPKMSGFELLVKIKELGKDGPKVLMNSGYSDYSLEDLFANGINGFFAKPFDSSVVRDCLTQSLLNPMDRWSKSYSIRGLQKISKDFTSVEDAERKHQFARGHIGFFVAQDHDLPQAGAWVDFHFSFAKAPVFAGLGIVQWVRDKANEHGPAGLGIEIKTLTPESLKPHVEWVSQYTGVASIPRS